VTEKPSPEATAVAIKWFDARPRREGPIEEQLAYVIDEALSAANARADAAEAERDRMKEALQKVNDEAAERAEGFYESARQYSVEREKEAEKRCMRQMHVWEKLLSSTARALAAPNEKEE